MNKNRNKKIYLLLIFILFFLFVGFAVLTSNLDVNGLFKFNKNTWDVQFSNIILEEESVGSIPSLSSDNTSLTFTESLNSSQDYYSFYVDIVNYGSVDAMLGNITKNTLSDVEKKYLLYEVTYADGSTISSNDPLDKGAVVTIKVTVRFRENIDNITDLPTVGQNISLSISTDFVYATSNSRESAATIMKKSVVTAGSGLYEDPYEEGRYVFKGSNPNNYIKFNGEIWRIISVEKDGIIKIMRKDSIGKFSFDEPGVRDLVSSTYCRATAQGKYGCNAWARLSELTPNDNFYEGTVLENSTLKDYLNTTYYESLSTRAKQLILKHGFNVGSSGEDNSTYSLEELVSNEKEYVWNGKVGLITLTEYMMASASKDCNSMSAFSKDTTTCGTSNWLELTDSWTLSPNIRDKTQVYYVHSLLSSHYLKSTEHLYNVRPVVYLPSYIKISGSGTSPSPYIVE